ncbi:MAG: phosphotransferase [Rhodospirillaceae bacterium]|nr:phosphotransferase [Rhodospirillaceae bacterium]
MRRPLPKNAGYVHAVLKHLDRVGFRASPRLQGIDEHGREVLGYIEGEPGPPHHPGRCIGDRRIASAGSMLRRFHDATAGTAIAAGCEVVCHNDWNPTNALFRGDDVIGMIDFDKVAPGTRLSDLGYAAFQWLDLGYPPMSGAEQCRRLGVLADAYGGVTLRDVADCVLERQAKFARFLGGRGEEELSHWVWTCRDWTRVHVAAAFAAGDDAA